MAEDNTKFYTHLWRITRRSQSTLLDSLNSNDAVFKPEFPPYVDNTQAKWYFGTGSSLAHSGARFFNQNCGDTVYWRSLAPVVAEDDPALLEYSGNLGDENPWYVNGNSNIRLSAITQVDYDNRILTNISSGDTNSVRTSNNCKSPSNDTRCLADTMVITDSIFDDANNQLASETANNAFTQRNINFYKFGQCSGVSYKIQCTWEQSQNNGVYTLGQNYTGTIVNPDGSEANLSGPISAIRVYIFNGRYTFSVDDANGTVDPLYLEFNGEPVYANNYPSGDVAVAEFGVKNVECFRVDNAVDDCGDITDLTSGLTEIITEVGITDHDRPIVFDGLEYVPYYGGSASDLTYGSGGEPSNNDIEFATGLPGISENDIISGLYQGAEIKTYYYDWGNQVLLSEDPPGYFGAITISDYREGAYKFKIEVKSALALMAQKDSVVITRDCQHQFGDSGCGVNLLAQGLVDDLTITAINSDQSLTVNSTQSDNYYGVIEFSKNDVIYSYNVASYNSTTNELILWRGHGSSGLEVGDIIKGVARCYKTPEDCKKFQGNLLNLLGAPYAPAETNLTRIR